MRNCTKWEARAIERFQHFFSLVSGQYCRGRILERGAMREGAMQEGAMLEGAMLEGGEEGGREGEKEEKEEVARARLKKTRTHH